MFKVKNKGTNHSNVTDVVLVSLVFEHISHLFLTRENTSDVDFEPVNVSRIETEYVTSSFLIQMRGNVENFEWKTSILMQCLMQYYCNNSDAKTSTRSKTFYFLTHFFSMSPFDLPWKHTKYIQYNKNIKHTILRYFRDIKK